MSGARIHLIYGVPLTEGHLDVIRGWSDTEDERYINGPRLDMRQYGFECEYNAHGSDNDCGYCGVQVGPAIGEGRVFDLVELTNRVPTRAQMAEAMAKFSALDADLRKVDFRLRLFVMWSNS